jgi:hypothetical protein
MDTIMLLFPKRAGGYRLIKSYSAERNEIDAKQKPIDVYRE